jgi:biuret amidohydrolase
MVSPDKLATPTDVARRKTMSAQRFFDFQHTFVPEVHLSWTDTALLIIDMQYSDASPDHGLNLALDKLDPGCMDYINARIEETVIPTIRKLLEEFREHEGARVVYLTLGSRYTDLRDVPEQTRTLVRKIEGESGVADILWAGNPAYAIREEVAPLPLETVVNKTTWGAFNSCNLDFVLTTMRVRSLVITGVSTNCCVESTVRDAADRGYACVVVDEGTADYDAEAHDAALRGMFFNFGRIARSGDDVVRALRTGQPI